MKRTSLAALAALLLLVATAAGGELKITVTSFPPGQPLQPGTAVLLSVSGLEPRQSPTWHPPEIEGDVLLKMGEQYLFAGTASGSRTFVVQVSTPGLDPFATVTFDYGDAVDPIPPPIPGTVSGVLIIEEQHDRTTAQGRIMDDPTWQTAALAAGLTISIQDKDHPKAQLALPAIAESELALPAVCLIDLDGAVIEVRAFPAGVDEMRALIGGLK